MRVTETKTDDFAFKYNPWIRDLTLGIGHAFCFSQIPQRFELDQNPFGDPNLVTMNNVAFSEDFSQLTFDARYQRKHRQFVITAANEQQKIMFEFFARLNANGFRTQDDEADHLELHFEKGGLDSIQIYKNDERCNLLDSLRIFSEAGRYFLVKQCPWRKFELTSMRVDDHRWISRSADEEFVFDLQVQPVIYETVKRLVDISTPPA
ncbi:MAG TPA: hypothetical protein VGD45_04860 [Steroidobacter sp.]|uniref:hypothetical protein n=1 Tax=Steroidobacter sp. TaxID=1978227 RepID=UPI002EDA9959